jgi:hypothetical protein
MPSFSFIPGKAIIWLLLCHLATKWPTIVSRATHSAQTGLRSLNDRYKFHFSWLLILMTGFSAYLDLIVTDTKCVHICSFSFIILTSSFPRVRLRWKTIAMNFWKIKKKCWAWTGIIKPPSYSGDLVQRRPRGHFPWKWLVTVPLESLKIKAQGSQLLCCTTLGLSLFFTC